MNNTVNRFGTKNDKRAWKTQYGLGIYGPFCYDSKFKLKENFIDKN